MKTKGIRKLRGLKRKMSNAVLLLVLLAIVVGIAYNIYNSLAENVVSFMAQALDNYGYLEGEEFELQAKVLDDEIYEIQLPELVNGKKVNEVYKVYLEKLENNSETVEGTEGFVNSETIENVEPLTENEQTVEIQFKEIEIAENKITLSKEQYENGKLTFELSYDVATITKNEEGTAQKELLASKTEEERNALVTEGATLYYNQLLKYENPANEKTVEVEGYLPLGAELKAEELTEGKVEEIFGEEKVSVAYDIELLIPVEKEIDVIDYNEDGTEKYNEDGTVAYKKETITELQEINVKELSEKYKVTLQDEEIVKNSQIAHVKDNGKIEEIAVISNEKESISFEASTFSIYAVIPPAGIFASSDSPIFGSINTDTENYSDLLIEFDADGNKTWSQSHSTTVTIKRNALKASDIKADDYGGYVTNYTPSNGSEVGWRIFYADSKNIYLIADNYAEASLIPTVDYVNIEKVETDNAFKNAFSINPVPGENTVERVKDIWKNGKGSLGGNSVYQIDYVWDDSFPDEMYERKNIQYSAYLTDENAWSGFGESEITEYVIGTPTIELFVSSYNETHGTAIDVFYCDMNGYYIAEDELSLLGHFVEDIDSYNDLYYSKRNAEYGSGYATTLKIASPSARTQNVNGVDCTGEYMFVQDNDGMLASSSESNGARSGARPVICLNSDVQLRKNSDGTYSILSGEAQYVDFDSLKYEWRKDSLGIPEASEITNTIPENAIEKEGLILDLGGAVDDTIGTKATTTITGNGMTGEWRLWIYAEDTFDQTNITGSEVFCFDNSGPEAKLSNSSPILSNATKEKTVNINLKEDLDIYTAEDIYIYSNDNVVENFKPINGSDVSWSIYNSDGNNIYLIADEYIDSQYLPVSSEIYEVTEYVDSRPVVKLNSNVRLELDNEELFYRIIEKDVGINRDSVRYVWKKLEEGMPTAEEITETLITEDTTEYLYGEDSKIIKIESAITKSGVDGSWKLYIYAEDTLGNSKITDLGKYVFDNTGPEIKIATSEKSPSTSEVITYHIDCNENLEEFDITDITVTNGNIKELKYITNTYYKLTVETVNSGEQTVSIPEGVCTDELGHPNQASNICTIIVRKGIATPEITINPNSNSTTSKSHSASIIIQEKEYGFNVEETMTIEYAWSASKIVTPTSWNQLQIDNESYYNGDKDTATVTVSASNLNGQYYLWVRPVYVANSAGDEATATIISNAFNFDNSGPNIVFEPNGNRISQKEQTTTVTVKYTDIENIITANDITASDYGAYVTNYEPTNGANVGWRIFHTDGDNIYLIADDYVDLQYVPTGRGTDGYGTNGTPVGTNNAKPKAFSLDPYVDYDGDMGVIENIDFLEKWMTKYIHSLNFAYSFNNEKATQYLIDTIMWERI